jgi:hypothetical protein
VLTAFSVTVTVNQREFTHDRPMAIVQDGQIAIAVGSAGNVTWVLMRFTWARKNASTPS